MTIEVSHGKARPVLPRAADLSPVKGERSTARKPQRLTKAAEAERKQRHRASHVGTTPEAALSVIPPADAAALRLDAQRMHGELMRDVGPCAELAVVQAMGVRASRWYALAGYYGAKADEAGPDTDRGMRLVDMEAKACARAERCSVTMLDFARVFGRVHSAEEDAGAAEELAEQAAEKRRQERRAATAVAEGEPA